MAEAPDLVLKSEGLDRVVEALAELADAVAAVTFSVVSAVPERSNVTAMEDYIAKLDSGDF
jgi:hypothetical protein